MGFCWLDVDVEWRTWTRDVMLKAAVKVPGVFNDT